MLVFVFTPRRICEIWSFCRSKVKIVFFTVYSDVQKKKNGEVGQSDLQKQKIKK